MRKINRKGEGSNMDLLIILIVGLVVLALLLGIIFRADLINYLRNLPDLGSSEEDKVIDIQDDKTVNNVVNCEEVGELVTPDLGKGILSGAKRAFIQRSYDIKINNHISQIAVYNDLETLDIRICEGIFGCSYGRIGNDLIGQIINGKILIEDKWINDENLRKDHLKLPSSEELKLIDDGYLGKSGLKICKKIEVKN